MDKEQEFKVIDKRRSSEADQKNNGASVELKESKTGNSSEQNAAQQRHSQDQIDFASFLVGVYSQTLIYLGEIPNPETQLVAKNIEAARQNIDILAIIQEKTKGNLSADEDGLLNEILNNVRLIFVKKI